MATTTNFGWETPDDTDLVKDGAAAIRTALGGVDTSFVDLKGGTTGQVLAKASATDLDFSWVAQDDSNAIQNALLTTTGDTIYASSASTPARRAIGTTGQVLTVSGGVPVWATPAGGGKVLQVVMGTTSTGVANSSSTVADTGLSASITPSSSSSKVLIIASQMGCRKSDANSGNGVQLFLNRDATQILNFAGSLLYTASSVQGNGAATVAYLDSPATTSATTYKTRFINQSAGIASVSVQANNETSTIILLEIGA